MKNKDVFFNQLLEIFYSAKGKSPDAVTKHFDFDGQILRIILAGSPSLQNLTLALEHLALPGFCDPDFTICCFDSVSTESPIPPPPWSADDYGERGEIRGFADERLKATYNIEAGLLSMANLEENMGLLWIQDPADLPYYETSAPFRRIFHWWMNGKKKEVIHSAAVGTNERGVLIAGRSGSGKSTISLACLLSGMFFGGDDYVLLNDSPEPHVFSLFNSAKLDWEQTKLFPDLEPLIWNKDRKTEEKALLFLYDSHRQKIKKTFLAGAILIPQITGERRTEITPARPADGLKALGPTTIFQQPWAGRFTFEIIARLVKRIPTFQLKLGTEINAIAERIKKFIQNEIQ